jgi:hypothetical protein
MRMWTLWLGVVLACGGCSPLAHVARTIVVEPAEYPRRIEEIAADCCDKKLAEIAWAKYQSEEPGAGYSRDFRLGFLDGYADYLYAGGTGNPPPVPPRWYWRAENESPEGHQAIRDWFDGFRVGAGLAKRSGYRELVTLPFSSPPPSASPGPSPLANQLPTSGAPPYPPPPPVLPPPVPVPPGPRSGLPTPTPGPLPDVPTSPQAPDE